MLRQLVSDRKPWSLGADENVGARANARRVIKRSQRNVNELTAANHRKQQAAAYPAMNIVRSTFMAKDHPAVFAVSNVQLVTLDTREWLECRAGCPPAVRAMAVQRIRKLVLHHVMDCAAKASASKQWFQAGFYRGCHD